MESRTRNRWTARIGIALGGVAAIWLTVYAIAGLSTVDLTIALLVVLAEVLLVAVLIGPVLAVLVALLAVFLLNWYVVPPFGTFAISSPDNLVALAVFVVVSVATSVLMEGATRARAKADRSTERAELLKEVVNVDGGADAESTLESIREALALDRVLLVSEAPERGVRLVRVASPGGLTGPLVDQTAPSLDVALADGYRLVGYGSPVMAADPDFLVSLGSIAVLAFDSERLAAESLRAQELATIDRSRTALLASVGHDLRTPLSGVVLGIETLRDGGARLTAAEHQELLGTIAEAAERLGDLIDNLLDMSRLQAGVVIVQPQQVDLGEILSRVLLGMPTSAGRVTVSHADELPLVWTDAVLMESVIANVLSNSVRHSTPGSPIGIECACSPSSVRLAVIDHGPGVPANMRDQIFVPFHRLGAHPDGGSGLGLAIVRGFCDAMDVAVSLADTAGGGLTVVLDIPSREPVAI